MGWRLPEGVWVALAEGQHATRHGGYDSVQGFLEPGPLQREGERWGACRGWRR